MRKLNNRGFAISTLLYGLMIMSLLIVFALMGNLSTNRQNTTNFVDLVEDELNRFSVSNTEGIYNGGEVDKSGHEYIAPKAGWYKIELWGASCGSNLGSYVSAIMYMEENDHIYFYLGQQGGSSNTFNSGSSGGGASDVRLISGDWNDASSLESRLMVAAGGSGSYSAGSLLGYGSSLYTGTQSSGAGFGVASGNGSGGYWGGKENATGSSFILGYGGVRTYENGTVTTKTFRTYQVHRGEYDSSGNAIMETYTPHIYNGFIVEGVNSGAGRFAISLVSSNDVNNPPRRGSNAKLNNVLYIRDCAQSAEVYWTEIQVIKDGSRVGTTFQSASGGTSQGNSASVTDGSINTSDTNYKITGTAGTDKCVTIKLPGSTPYNLDEIAVWHKINVAVQGHYLAVSSNGTTWTPLRDTNSGKTNEKETSDGIRYNTFQYDSLGELPDGNYYIFAGNSNKQVLTLKDEGSSILSFMDTFSPNDKQVWYVHKSGSGYIIENTNNQKVMDLSVNFGRVYLTDNTSSASQIFSINSVGDGYYTITANNGNRLDVSSTVLQGLAVNNSSTQEFKFVVADY